MTNTNEKRDTTTHGKLRREIFQAELEGIFTPKALFIVENAIIKDRQIIKVNINEYKLQY